jgi:hypothetical protein
MSASLSLDRGPPYYHADASREGSRMLRHTAFAAVLLVAAPLAHAESPRFGLDVEFLHDSNASRGLYDADRKADNILSVEGSLAGSAPLGARGGFVWRAAARYDHFTTFEDLSNVALIGRAAYRVQPGTEFSSPFFEIAASGAWLQHADSEIRDGTILSLEASIGSHLTDRVRLAGGLSVDTRDGGDPGRPGEFPIYDMDYARVWATLDYRLGVKNTLYGRIMHITGDHVFNSVTVSGISADPTAWATDPALGRELGGTVNSYRVDASTFTYDLGVNLPLAGNRALDFFVSSYSSKVNEGPYSGSKYTGYLLRASYLYRFQ